MWECCLSSCHQGSDWSYPAPHKPSLSHTYKPRCPKPCHEQTTGNRCFTALAGHCPRQLPPLPVPEAGMGNVTIFAKFTSQYFVFTYRNKISSIWEGKSFSDCFLSAFEGTMYKQGIQLQTIIYQGSTALEPNAKNGSKVKAHSRKMWGSVQKPMYNFQQSK